MRSQIFGDQEPERSASDGFPELQDVAFHVARENRR